MIQLSSPMRVTPSSCTVPRLKVHELADRVAVADHQLASARRAYFLSCGAAPIEANWKMRLSRPIVVWPSITHVRADRGAGADRTCGPMTV